MAPTRTVKSKLSSSTTIKGKWKGNKSFQSGNRNGATDSSSKTRVSKQLKGPPPKQQKTKPALAPVKKKRKIYTEKELGIPQLNMITPVGVQVPKGKKKGKVFVDDQVWSPLCGQHDQSNGTLGLTCWTSRKV
jgi:60S ribosomal subunit assembly/export protein LOC1